MKEIAHLAGVSIGTVDRVLHDRGSVAPETKKKIDDIIASLDYRPNIMARQLSLGKVFRLRVLLPRSDQDSGYWALCRSGIMRAARDLSPYGVKVEIDEFDRYDDAAYRALLADIASDPGDGILAAPVLPEELSSLLKSIEHKAESASFTYAFFDDVIEGLHPVAAVCQDAKGGGYLAGRIMTMLAPRGEVFAAVNAHVGDRHIGLRIEGFSQYLREHGSIELVTIDCPGLDSSDQAKAALVALRRRKHAIDGILVANASGHVIGEELAEEGGTRPALISWDLVSANARCLREGKLDCVISQRPAEQAREALERLFRAVAHGEAQSESAVVPIEIYFKENLPPESASYEEE